MTTPTLAPGAKLAPPVDLEATDQERQNLYGDLSAVREKALQDPATAAPATPDFTPLEVDDGGLVITDDDKRAFVRSVLGNKAFEKTFTLFGEIEVVFADRTVEATNRMYETMAGITDPESWRLALDQRHLASTLCSVTGPGLKITPGGWKTAEELDANHVIVTKLSKPLYKALLQTSRRFEALVAELTESAHLENFWPAGGAASPSPRTSPARSTTGAPAVRTGR